jgi:succinate dehydrogenase/fumarate reductase flavoprotein subunit
MKCSLASNNDRSFEAAQSCNSALLRPVPGLYATGDCTAGVTGACYPGPGASIGASFIFGCRAMRHATGVNDV